jgi:hypothetical protein
MTFQRRFAPIGGRFDPESLAGLTGIYRKISCQVKVHKKR